MVKNKQLNDDSPLSAFYGILMKIIYSPFCDERNKTITNNNNDNVDTRGIHNAF